MTKITVAKGDGIGPEIMDATLKIIKAAGAEIEIDEIELDYLFYSLGKYHKLINPKTLEDRELIVNEAYVTSKRRERFIDPIDKVIRASRPYSEVDTITLQDSENPKEILDKFRSYKTLENKIYD